MKYALIILALLPVGAMGQAGTQLKRELDSMYVLDQRNREWLTRMSNDQPFTDSLSAAYKVDRKQLAGKLWTEQSKIDSSNMARVDAIVKQYGYPGNKLVGRPTNEAVFYIVQHSNKIPAYLPLIKKAAENDDLPFSLYAMMLDRSLMYDGKPQLYGSQVSCRQLLESKQQRCFVWPVSDAKTVNDRRKKAGFLLTVEENANRLNAAYEPELTMDIARKTYVLN